MFTAAYKNILLLLAAFILFFVQTAPAEVQLPATIAVLPVAGNGEQTDLEELRRTFFNHIGSKNYIDIELGEVDSKIFVLEKKTGMKWEGLSPAEVAEALSADGLVYVDVIGIDKIYAGVYGSLTVKMRVKLVDPKTGDIIWEKEHSVIKQSGGIPLSPWSAISTAVSSALVLRDSVKISLFDQLCRAIAKEMPEPASLVKSRPPTIFSVMTNALDSPFNGGKEILISMKGDTGLTAYFNIGGAKTGVQLTETDPGHYLGKYTVTAGDNWQDKLLEVYLSNMSTRLEAKYTVPNSVTVDTVPPAEPSSLGISTAKEGLLIRWVKPADEDVEDFVITKADLQSSEFKEIASTAIPEYIDPDVAFGNKYYYRVAARDKAGNTGKYCETDKMVVRPGPTEVPQDISNDTVFYSLGSPYVINGATVLRKGVKLSVEPGTTISFEPGSSLTVAGTMNVYGNADEPVTIKGSGYSIFFSDTGRNGGSFSYVSMREGDVVSLLNSSAEFRNVRMESFTSGVLIQSGSHLQLDSSEFLGNGTGINMESGGLSFDNVTFKGNSFGLKTATGCTLSAGSALFAENEVDVEAAEPVRFSRLDVNGREPFDVLKRMHGEVDAPIVIPLAMTYSQMKTEAAKSLQQMLADELVDENYKEAVYYAGILQELFPESYESVTPAVAFAYFNEGEKEKASELLGKSRDSGAATLAGILGITQKQTGEDTVIFTRVQLPIMKTSAGLEQTAKKRASALSVKEFLSGVINQLDREKQFTLNSKLISRAEEFTTVSIPVYSNYDRQRFDGVYLVFLDSAKVETALQEFNLVKGKQKDVRVGIVGCGGSTYSVPYLRKALKDMGFQVEEVSSKGGNFTDYGSIVSDRKLDLLIMADENHSVSGSRVSSNLNMINSNLEIDCYTSGGERLFNLNKGLLTYHMNEDMGKKTSARKAFSELSDYFTTKMLSAEKAVSPSGGASAANSLSPEAVQTVKAAPRQALAPVKIVEPVKKAAPKAELLKPETVKAETAKQEKLVPEQAKAETPKFVSVPKPVLGAVSVGSPAVSVAAPSPVIQEKPKELPERMKVEWSTARKFAMLINPALKSVQELASDIKTKTSEKIYSSLPGKAPYIIGVLETLSKDGIIYQADIFPFVKAYNQQSEGDAKFPFKVMTDKRGDHDDLYILFASLMEAEGVNTGVAISNRRMVVLADTGAAKADGLESLFIEMKGTLWMPLDLSLIDRGAASVWKTGSAGTGGLAATHVTFLNDSRADYLSESCKDGSNPVKVPSLTAELVQMTEKDVSSDNK